jgi:hypothetical protein
LNSLDSGAGSLRDAILHENGDTINFAPSLDGQTITLTSVRQSLAPPGAGAGLIRWLAHFARRFRTR